jgi:hypothetical protein
MKKWTIPLIAAMAITTTFSVITLARRSPTFVNSRATPVEYTLTLDDTNSPEIVDSTSADKDINEYISLHYEGTSMSARSGRHIIMGSGKFYNTKQIREITNIKVTAPVNTDNLLVLYVGYTLEDIIAEKYAYSIIGTSQVSIDTKCNYFGLYSSKTYGISNVTITYGCPSDSSKPEAPTAPDTQKLVYGGSNKKLVIDNGAGTFKDAQTVVTNADGLQYNYKYATFSVEFKFPSSVIASSSDSNFGLQAQKYMNADGGPNAAFQFGITNFSTSAWAVKVSGTSRDSGTLATPLAADTWYEFKVVLSSGSSYKMDCYIDGTLISSTQRGSMGKNLYTYGMRFGNGSLGEISFRNMSLTGHN